MVSTARYPSPSSPAVTAVMRGNRKVDTRPEVRLRSALHREGLRFRKDYPVAEGGIRVRPDVVFPRARVAVFLDGCFWHACPEHGTQPTTNATYWLRKLARNVERDREITVALRELGWTVVRIWEHENPDKAAVRVLGVLHRMGFGATPATAR